jgi:hypothetical protein
MALSTFQRDGDTPFAWTYGLNTHNARVIPNRAAAKCFGREPRFVCVRYSSKFSDVNWHKFRLGRNLAAVLGFVGGPTQAGDQYGHDGSISQICRRMRSNGQDQPQSRKQDILEWLSPAMVTLCATDGETR